jgi:non-ribosomal peptide synthetase component F
MRPGCGSCWRSSNPCSARPSPRPIRRIGALALATDSARAVLPDPAEPLDATWRGAVHEIFAAHARRTPDALAVEDPRERWTYAELDADADAIAAELAARGIGIGDVAAITGHRGAALVRALLGVLKSGAAFLVLDPAYPPARLAEYVRIARPAAHLHLTAAGDLPSEPWTTRSRRRSARARRGVGPRAHAPPLSARGGRGVRAPRHRPRHPRVPLLHLGDDGRRRRRCWGGTAR